MSKIKMYYNDVLKVHQRTKEVLQSLEHTQEFTLVIKDTTKRKWKETHVYKGKDPLKYFEQMISNFNKSLRPHEFKRTLINVYEKQIITKFERL